MDHSDLLNSIWHFHKHQTFLLNNMTNKTFTFEVYAWQILVFIKNKCLSSQIQHESQLAISFLDFSTADSFESLFIKKIETLQMSDQLLSVRYVDMFAYSIKQLFHVITLLLLLLLMIMCC